MNPDKEKIISQEQTAAWDRLMAAKTSECTISQIVNLADSLAATRGVQPVSDYARERKTLPEDIFEEYMTLVILPLESKYFNFVQGFKKAQFMLKRKNLESRGVDLSNVYSK